MRVHVHICENQGLLLDFLRPDPHVRESTEGTIRWYTQSQYINGTIDTNIKMHTFLIHPESRMQKVCKFPQVGMKSNSFETQKTDFVFLWCLGWRKSEFSNVGVRSRKPFTNLIWVYQYYLGKETQMKRKLKLLSSTLYWKRSLPSFTEIQGSQIHEIIQKCCHEAKFNKHHRTYASNLWNRLLGLDPHPFTYKWPYANFLTSLWLSFLFYTMGIIVVPNS